MAFAPSDDLFGVPSAASNISSTAVWLVASSPSISGPSTLMMWWTAFCTPRP